MTHDQALAAIQAELGPERPLAALPPDIREWVGGIVARGSRTAAQAAEALVLAMELADAKESSEITDEVGVEVMQRLGVRHREGHAPD